MAEILVRSGVVVFAAVSVVVDDPLRTALGIALIFALIGLAIERMED